MNHVEIQNNCNTDAVCNDAAWLLSALFTPLTNCGNFTVYLYVNYIYIFVAPQRRVTHRMNISGGRSPSRWVSDITRESAAAEQKPAFTHLTRPFTRCANRPEAAAGETRV